MNKTIYTVVMTLLTMTYGYSQCACCAGAGTGSSNGDYNNGILTLPKNKWVAETYADYRTINQSNTVATAKADEEETPLKNMLITSFGVRYGLTNTITISALIPYVFLHTDTGNDSGLGDLVVMSTFNVLNKNNFSLALQAGLELPTGTQKSSAFDNTTVVVGSGSYDPMVGIIVAKRWDKYTLQANGLYKQTTKGFHDNYYGSIAIQNVTLNYRILGAKTSCALMPTEETDKPTESTPDATTKTTSANLSWSVFGGYYGEWLDNIKEEDVVDDNSGYYLGYATLGTTLSYKTWSFPLTASLPIIQNMNGDQNNGGFRIRLGIIKSF
ncbi:transporter [Flavobacterium sp.]|uniref:transporter n=1 Tax=Flavobacterium sp. TaxID=239 RepID=UPI002FD9C339